MRSDREGQLFYINTKWRMLFLANQKQKRKVVFFLSWLLHRYLQECKFTMGKPLPFKTFIQDTIVASFKKNLFKIF